MSAARGPDASTPPRDGAALARAALALHGRTVGEEAGIPLARNTPSALFRWLCACLLLSARIASPIALRAAAQLAAAGWTTARRLAESRWEDRIAALDRAGYARYDERTATYLGAAAERALALYGGDLRRLRAHAGGDPAAARALLTGFKGIGPVGADLFLREAQAVWPEFYPFVDAKAHAAAARLCLPDDPAALARLVDRTDFPRLLAALLRIERAGDAARVRAAAETSRASARDGRGRAR
ncbi:MAG: endonuclease [Alphaproteobacteria bacterium]|nr:endonuclease [Alphaproteobacteria bacterium]